MKRFLVLIIICGTINVHAQNEKRNYLGGHVSFGKSNYSSDDRIGDAVNRDYTGINYFTFGFDYSHRDSGGFEVGTGISVTSNKMALVSNLMFAQNNKFKYDETLFIFSIPVNLKLHFLKYLFVGAGLSFNYHPRMGYTWGVGGKINIGAEYTFNSGISVSISPEMQSNILNLGSSPEGSIGTDKLTQKGINIGLGYRF
ncbi:hypothetical protein AGMMS49982_00910 [Bacteroidia bacterium]|nr:hypothetical protein AGMMS49982_00910 [Bacteroidia bacterium]